MAIASRLAVLGLSLACAWVYAVPRISSVEPAAVPPGGEAVAIGSDLGKTGVDSLYLTVGGTDVEVKVLEQSDEEIKFQVPDSTEKKRYRLMVLTAGAGQAYMEQPVALEVVDAETAKRIAQEGEAELEVVEAEPEDPGN